MKLALGTVQFGLDYGVSNQGGQVAPDAACEILAAASRHGITTLDTAAAYGTSERVLGDAGIAGFDVISKFADLDGSMDPEREFANSLEALGVSSLYGYLVHDAGMLLEQDRDGGGDALYRRLDALKGQGLVRKIGVSIYRPEELVTLSDRYDLDLVQLPCNAIDKRWEEPGLVDKILHSEVEVHVRSVFLQGLLLMPKGQVSAYFEPWASLLAQWHEWCCRRNVTPLEACLGALSGREWISKLVVGVTSATQLDELASAAKTLIDDLSGIPQTDDEGLLNPARWHNV